MGCVCRLTAADVACVACWAPNHAHEPNRVHSAGEVGKTLQLFEGELMDGNGMCVMCVSSCWCSKSSHGGQLQGALRRYSASARLGSPDPGPTGLGWWLVPSTEGPLLDFQKTTWKLAAEKR